MTRQLHRMDSRSSRRSSQMLSAGMRLVEVCERRKDGLATTTDVEFSIRQALRAGIAVAGVVEMSGFSEREVIAQRDRL